MADIIYNTQNFGSELFGEVEAETVIEISSGHPWCQHRLTLMGLGESEQAAKKNLIDNVWNIIHTLTQFATLESE